MTEIWLSFQQHQQQEHEVQFTSRLGVCVKAQAVADKQYLCQYNLW